MKRKDAHDFLRNAGLRLTPLKRQVVDLFLAGGCGLSAGDVHAGLHGSCDKSSVYRCLKGLLDVGFLRYGIGGRGVVQYRCEKGFFPDHGHFHCRYCGEIIPVENRFAGDLIAELESRYNLEINSMDFMLEGRCGNCSKRS